jgi:Cft2 family RNA processing exonuclease
MFIQTKRIQEEFHLTGDWARTATRLLEDFEQLTDIDVILEPGSEEKLLTKIANRLKVSRERVIDIIQRVQQSR